MNEKSEINIGKVFVYLLILAVVVLIFVFGDKIVASITGLVAIIWEKLREARNPLPSQREHDEAIAEINKKIKQVQTETDAVMKQVEANKRRISEVEGEVNETDRQIMELIIEIGKKEADLENMTLEEMIEHAQKNH